MPVTVKVPLYPLFTSPISTVPPATKPMVGVAVPIVTVVPDSVAVTIVFGGPEHTAGSASSELSVQVAGAVPAGHPGIGAVAVKALVAGLKISAVFCACGSSQPNPCARVSPRRLVSSAGELEV